MKRTRLFLLSLIALALAVACSLSMISQYRTARLVSNHIQYSAWSLAQMELELQKFYSNISLYAAGSVDHNALMFSYDLLWNRLSVFLVGKENRTLRERFNAEAKVRNLYNTLQDNEDNITTLSRTDKQSIHDLELAFYPYVDQVRELVMLNFTGKESTKMYEDVLYAQKQLAWLLGGLFVVVILLVASLSRQSRRYYRLAHRDSLTGLANRARLQAELEDAIHATQTDSPYFALCLLRINGFKTLNLRLGYHQGDDILVRMAQRLNEHVRHQDLVARLEKDTFAVLLRHIPDESATLETARYFRQSLVFDYSANGRLVRLDTHIGISLYPMHGTNASELLSSAFAALELARDTSEQIEIYQQVLQEDRINEQKLVQELQEQLRFCDETSGLELRYIPVESPVTGALEAMRLRLYWQHPRFGELNSQLLLSLAEHNNLSQNLASWICERVTHDFHHSSYPWPFQLRIIADMPAALLTPAFPSWLEQMLQRHVLSPSQIILAFTEEQLLLGSERNVRILDELRALGVRTMLFGHSGSHESLNVITGFPLDMVLLDENVIRQARTSARLGIALSAIVEMYHTLNLQIIGVADEDERESAGTGSSNIDLWQSRTHAAGIYCDEVLAAYVGQSRESLPPASAPAALPPAPDTL